MNVELRQGITRKKKGNKLMTERLAPTEFQSLLAETKEYMIRKCLRMSGNKQAYYFIAQQNYGDRYIVFFTDSKEPPLELTPRQFNNMFVTSPPHFSEKLQVLWNSFPEYERRGNA